MSGASFNVFAILGLRALYFLLSRVMGMFTYLKLGVSFVLAFVGVKMLLADTIYEIPVQFSLGVIFGALLISITISIIMDNRGGDSGTGATGAKQ